MTQPFDPDFLSIPVSPEQEVYPLPSYEPEFVPEQQYVPDIYPVMPSDPDLLPPFQGGGGTARYQSVP